MFKGTSPSTNIFCFHFAGSLQRNFKCLTERTLRSFLKLANASPLILCGELASSVSRHRTQDTVVPCGSLSGEGNVRLGEKQDGQEGAGACRPAAEVCTGARAPTLSGNVAYWRHSGSEFGSQPDRLRRSRGKEIRLFVQSPFVFFSFLPSFVHISVFILGRREKQLSSAPAPWNQQSTLDQTESHSHVDPSWVPRWCIENMKPPEAQLRTSLRKLKKVK